MVAVALDCEPEDFMVNRKLKTVVFAKRLVIHVCRERFSMSWPEIADYFGVDNKGVMGAHARLMRDRAQKEVRAALSKLKVKR